MTRILFAALFLFSSAAFAQICDVTYSWEAETMDGQDVGNGTATFFAQPMSEVNINHKAQRKVLDAMSKEQDKKGGIYRADVWEYRACDGGAKVKVAEGSASIQGVTYAGVNRIMAEAIKQAKVILKHHEDRVAKGNKSAWDHGKAKKVKRDDLGARVVEK